MKGLLAFSPSLPHLEHLMLEIDALRLAKPTYVYFAARIWRQILAEQLTHFIRKLL